MRKVSWIHLPLSSRIAFCIVALLFGLAIFAPLLAPYDPRSVHTEEILTGVSLHHWLGTDELGRDVLTRVIYGARTSVAYAVAATLCTAGVGTVLGVVGGYFGGVGDRMIQGVVGIFQGLPGMSLMLAIAALLPEGDTRLILALTLTGWPGFSRVIRSEVQRIRSETYIDGVKSLGAKPWYIIRYYVLPNLLPLFTVLLTLRVGSSLLSASALSYLGLGVAPPTADWGVMISDARIYFRSYPLLIIAPGVGLTLLSLAINLAGDGLRTLWVTSENGGRER